MRIELALYVPQDKSTNPVGKRVDMVLEGSNRDLQEVLAILNHHFGAEHIF